MESTGLITSGCTETDKPLIAILMAVYEPRMDWLEEQLTSLNRQTYPNLRLYIRDDHSPIVPFAEIEALVRRCVTAFPYTIEQNERNLGSNGTFELLTQEAEGDFFAYCDQDDIWLPEKLTALQKELERSKALLACSDMYVIDGNGKTVADSITKVRRHHHFRSGEGLAEGLLISNFVTGCTMLVKSTAAKAAVPFCPYMVHDHYIALCCATNGEILTVMRPLIQYRVHGGNQTGIMAGVKDKESYADVRIDVPIQKFEWLLEKFICDATLKEQMNVRLQWLQARKENWLKRGNTKKMWNLRKCGKQITFYEVVAARLPEKLFLKTIDLARRNIL